MTAGSNNKTPLCNHSIVGEGHHSTGGMPKTNQPTACEVGPIVGHSENCKKGDDLTVMGFETARHERGQLRAAK